MLPLSTFRLPPEGSCTGRGGSQGSLSSHNQFQSCLGQDLTQAQSGPPPFISQASLNNVPSFFPPPFHQQNLHAHQHGLSQFHQHPPTTPHSRLLTDGSANSNREPSMTVSGSPNDLQRDDSHIDEDENSENSAALLSHATPTQGPSNANLTLDLALSSRRRAHVTNYTTSEDALLLSLVGDRHELTAIDWLGIAMEFDRQTTGRKRSLDSLQRRHKRLLAKKQGTALDQQTSSRPSAAPPPQPGVSWTRGEAQALLNIALQHTDKTLQEQTMAIYADYCKAIPGSTRTLDAVRNKYRLLLAGLPNGHEGPARGTRAITGSMRTVSSGSQGTTDTNNEGSSSGPRQQQSHLGAAGTTSTAHTPSIGSTLNLTQGDAQHSTQQQRAQLSHAPLSQDHQQQVETSRHLEPVDVDVTIVEPSGLIFANCQPGIEIHIFSHHRFKIRSADSPREVSQQQECQSSPATLAASFILKITDNGSIQATRLPVGTSSSFAALQVGNGRDEHRGMAFQTRFEAPDGLCVTIVTRA